MHSDKRQLQTKSPQDDDRRRLQQERANEDYRCAMHIYTLIEETLRSSRGFSRPLTPNHRR